MKKIALIAVLALAGCAGSGVPETLTRDCADWPSAGPGGVSTNTRALELAAQGKLAHADCKARYDALRGAVR